VTIQQIKGKNIVTITVEKPPASLAAKALA
jgi:hypothetical protein